MALSELSSLKYLLKYASFHALHHWKDQHARSDGRKSDELYGNTRRSITLAHLYLQFYLRNGYTQTPELTFCILTCRFAVGCAFRNDSITSGAISRITSITHLLSAERLILMLQENLSEQSISPFGISLEGLGNIYTLFEALSEIDLNHTKINQQFLTQNNSNSRQAQSTKIKTSWTTPNLCMTGLIPDFFYISSWIIIQDESPNIEGKWLSLASDLLIQSMLEILLCSRHSRIEELLCLLPWMDVDLFGKLKTQIPVDHATVVLAALQNYIDSLAEMTNAKLIGLISYVTNLEDDQRYLLEHYQNKYSFLNLEDRKLDLVESVLKWMTGH